MKPLTEDNFEPFFVAFMKYIEHPNNNINHKRLRIYLDSITEEMFPKIESFMESKGYKDLFYKFMIQLV